jgi:cellulose synthase/poly-beta-1,6-N-acetylglucosamine synthase-like glycosyltransferase
MEVTEPIILGYFLAMNSVYVFLLAASAVAIYLRQRELNVENLNPILRSDSLPPITFIVPAFNEAKSIVFTLHNLMNLHYRYKEIILVNDGSSDQTMDALKDAFDLVKVPAAYPQSIHTRPIRAFYQSRTYENLFVIDKENGGKPDALNAGINACSSPFFIALDADTLVDNNFLNSLIRPILMNPETIVAGASVRVANGCKIELNRIVTYDTPRDFVTGIQSVEYLRAFSLGRLGWEYLGGNLIVSGAFGIFQKEAALKVHGYDVETVGEDMDIIVRLHCYMTEHRLPYKITYIPDPVAWTEVPDNFRTLEKQRERWHRGLVQCLWRNKKMFFNPRYKALGLFVFPFFVLGDAISPLIELIGYCICIAGFWFGLIDVDFFALFFLSAWGFTTVMTLLCIFMEEVTYRQYATIRSVFMMIFCAFLESFGFRQMTVLWRVKAVFRSMKRKPVKYEMEKRGFRTLSR